MRPLFIAGNWKMNPKTAEAALAAGKPVLSTRVAGFRDSPQFVYLADDAQGFATLLPQALDEAVDLPARRQAEAAKHSWDARLDAVEAVIAACVRPRGQTAKVGGAK